MHAHLCLEHAHIGRQAFEQARVDSVDSRRTLLLDWLPFYTCQSISVEVSVFIVLIVDYLFALLAVLLFDFSFSSSSSLTATDVLTDVEVLSILDEFACVERDVLVRSCRGWSSNAQVSSPIRAICSLHARGYLRD